MKSANKWMAVDAPLLSCQTRTLTRRPRSSTLATVNTSVRPLSNGSLFVSESLRWSSPESPNSPNRTTKTLASVPAPDTSLVFTETRYVFASTTARRYINTWGDGDVIMSAIVKWKWKWLFIANCYETIIFQYAIVTDRAGVQPIGYRPGPRPRAQACG